jgi:hypothetical protein
LLILSVLRTMSRDDLIRDGVEISGGAAVSRTSLLTRLTNPASLSADRVAIVSQVWDAIKHISEGEVAQARW